ncbi:MAG TPA: TMEM175 family protein [Streptosporangiaceae bacterium]|nr:TMEM175 family protein [Streptosporangiaceae bacterium]
MDTRRAEAFSDGVFAVAITVLVFGLLPIGTGDHVTRALLSAWPQYIAYVVSFLTIGIMWLNHHTLMAQMRRVNRPLLVLNLLLLMGVVAVPFPTALVADHLHGAAAAGGRAATVTYGLLMIAISVAFSAMWLYLGHNAGDVARRAAHPPPRFTSVRFSAGLVGYAAGTVVAIFSPGAALAIYGLVAVYYLFEHLPDPSDEHPPGPDLADSEAGEDGAIAAGSGEDGAIAAGSGEDGP